MEKKENIRFWLINHTYKEATDKNRDDLINQAEKNNYAFMQYEYNKQENQVVTPTYKNAMQINVGDYIFLRAKDFIYAYGKAIIPRKVSTKILSLKKIIDERDCEYSSETSKDIILFDDAPVFYFDFSEGEENWGERVDVEKWMISKSPVSVGNVKYLDSLPYPPIREIDKDSAEIIIEKIGESILPDNSLADQLADLLQHTHNLILHGAPGTGKTFLAKEIAKKMGCSQDEIGFVQFHPSYDYTDFVEGLRPKSQNNGEIGFERKDGVFKEFCKRALLAMNVSSVSDNFEQVWENVVDYLNEKDFMDIPLLTGKSTFRVELNENGDGLATRTYENGDYKKGEWIQGKSKFYNKEQLYNIYKGLPGIPSRGHDNYRKAVIEYWKKNFGLVDYAVKEKSESESVKPFLFIIDEINRGELSKIFGELFFCIDPDYRGKNGMIKTQYQNLIENGDEFYDGFFIPENVYIIGTMNDIDRSVDTMDFAFRRRFAFKEIKASENLEMLAELGEITNEAKTRLTKLNEEISKITELSSPSSYHIGGSYFLKLNDFEGDSNERFQNLWDYHLEELLKEYLRGTENEEENFAKLEKAYFGLDSAANNSEEDGR